MLLCWGPRASWGWGTLACPCPPLFGCVSPSLGSLSFSASLGRERLDSYASVSGLQGEFRVVERKITMKEVLRALEEGRVREIFGSGTACQVCPVHQILYEGKVRRGCHWRWEEGGGGPSSRHCLPQHLHIPTMENGPELILRFQEELKAIQVRCTRLEMH